MKLTHAILFGFCAGLGYLTAQELWLSLTGLVGLCYG